MMKKQIQTKDGELILQGPKCKPVFRGDIDREIFNQDYVRYYIDKKTGLFIILPKGEKLLRALTNYFVSRLIKKFSFDRVILPKMSPVSTYAKASVLGKWDYYLEKVSPFHRTHGVKQDYILEPLQCIPFYQFLENKKLDVSKTPIKVFDSSGPTYRNEDLDKLKPLVKHREFHRAEFIYIGNKKDIVSLRENILKELMLIYNQFGIKYRIVVGGGCFELSENEIVYPDSVDDIPIKDLEVYVPSTKTWVEVVGASVLWNIQTKRFNITGISNQELWSGCVGIGLERLMYTFLAQKGFDPAKWPKEIRSLIHG